MIENAILEAELIKMRRNPANFKIGTQVKCKFCSKPKSAYHLLNAKSDEEVGTWCPTHGWLTFNSVQYPPTERLKPSEIEDVRLRQRRQQEFAKRKEAQQ